MEHSMITLTDGVNSATISDDGTASGDSLISAYMTSYIYALSTSDGDPHMNLAGYIQQNPSIGYTVVDATFMIDESTDSEDTVLY